MPEISPIDYAVTALPVVPKQFPQRWSVDIRGQEYFFEIAFNEVGKFFTMSISDRFGEMLVQRPLLYGVDALAQTTIEGLEEFMIVPFDFAFTHMQEGLAIDNFGDDVLLFCSPE